jgi:hypothetical protein
VIRFSAALVVVAIGVLIGGVATSSLLLVYVAIGISAAALLALAVGVLLKRDELFAEEARSAGVTGNGTEMGSSARTPSAAEGASAGGASQPRVAAGVGGSAYGDPVFGDSVFRDGDSVFRDSALRDTASGDASFGNASFGDWALTRSAQQSPVQHAHDGTSGRLGAWPPPAFGSPAAPAAGDAPPPGTLPPGTLPSGTPSPIPPASFRRPPAPQTRADPVLPWSDSLPTRVDIGGAPAGSTSAPGKPPFGDLEPGEAARSATPRSPNEDAESLPSGSSGGQFAWRDITWDDNASDEPGGGEQDSGERDHAASDARTATAAAPASTVPPPSTARPSWLDDVDDASDADQPLDRSERDDSPLAAVGEADDLPGSGESSHHWQSGAEGDGLTYDVGPDHAAASGFTEDAEADADVESNGIDLDATAALDILPGLDAATGSDLVADTGRDAWTSLDADTGSDPVADTGRGAWTSLDADTGTNPDAGASTDLDGGSETGRDAWMKPAPETGADLDAGADPDAELPGAPDDDDSAPAESGLPSDGTAAAVPSATGQVTVVPGVPRYHEENCILIRFMADGNVQRMTVPEAEKAGCTPCRACQSED